MLLNSMALSSSRGVPQRQPMLKKVVWFHDCKGTPVILSETTLSLTSKSDVAEPGLTLSNQDSKLSLALERFEAWTHG